MGWGAVPASTTTTKDKTVQLSHPLSTKEEPVSGLETALVKLPETYEECESIARELFNAPADSKLVMKVAISSGSIFGLADYAKTSNWMVVHKSAYSTAILNYSGALEIRVDFEGSKAGEDTQDKAPATSSDTFLMI